jgi:hypothetical protein
VYRPGDSAWIGTNGNQKGLYLGYTAGGVAHPIEAFASMFSQHLQHVAEHCHVEELLCRVFARILAVFLAMLGSNASVVFGRDPQ